MRVHFGTHYLFSLQQQERPRVRTFYVDILGCRIEAHDHNVTANIPENIDLFHFPDGEVFGVQYVAGSDAPLTTKEYRQACWLELKTDDVEGLVKKLKASGVEEITDFWDTEHFYFHAPGGQVFRVIGLAS
jgi:catechol 2,3-dioxygenase-like lactoylglutathione lyase family enzyme